MRMKIDSKIQSKWTRTLKGNQAYSRILFGRVSLWVPLWIMFSLIGSACKSPYRLDLSSSLNSTQNTDQNSLSDQGVDDVDLGQAEQDQGASIEWTCDAQGPTFLYAVYVMRFAEVVDGISAGFNLDGEVSELAGSTGCGRSDFTDAQGRMGIDNQFASLIPVLDPVLGQPLNEALARTLSEKALILLVEVQGLDDPQNDDCVRVNLLRGNTQVLVGNDGYLLEGQSYALDPDLPWAKASEAWIEEGRLITSAFELDLPISFSGINLDLFLDEAYLEMSLDSTKEYTGVLGGRLPLEALVQSIANIESSIEGIARQVLSGKADLSPDESGQCQAISIAWTFQARSGYLYLDSWHPEQE